MDALYAASTAATLYAREDGTLYLVPDITATIDAAGVWTQGHRWIATQGRFAKKANDLSVQHLTLI